MTKEVKKDAININDEQIETIDVSDNTSNEVKNIMTDELKKKIICELENNSFPNLEFLFSEEVLNSSVEILEDFLKEEKEIFNNILSLKDEEITFEVFDRKSNLNTLWGYLSHLEGVNDSDKVREIKDIILPKLVDFGNEVSYSKRYFEMLVYCLQNCELNIEQEKIIKDEIRDFKNRGIALDSEKKEELKSINLKLSELSKNFSKNVLDSEKEFEYFLETDEFLKEFPKGDLENAKNLAEKKGKKGYSFDSSDGSYLAIMKYCSDSEVRRYFFEEWTKFASSGEFDNRENILDIISLKNKKAQILEHNNFAELSLEKKMAKSPEEVLELLGDISSKAKNKAVKELDELKQYFDLEEVNPWDISYYFRKLKKEKYDLDDKELKNYFEFENTKNALFDTVKKLYNVEMKLLDTNGEYAEDLEIYEVFHNGKLISYFIGDYYYNENKRSGAWANDIRTKSKDRLPIVVNVMSVTKSENNNTLMTLGEVTTMFHEFGHALHVMLSKSDYSDLSGFGVEWDFVELPSQIMEKWATDSDTIKNIAKHYETGESLNNDLHEAYKKLDHFGTGNSVLGQNIYAIIDMMFYSGIEFKDVEELDKKYIDKVKELSLFNISDNNKRYASFSHIFAGGYSAGYYSYMWADIIVDEIWAKFKEKGVYNKEFATEFEEKILGAGSIKKASEMFEDLMGRGVKIDAFLKEKGLV